jgi:hypothetical protein
MTSLSRGAEPALAPAPWPSDGRAGIGVRGEDGDDGDDLNWIGISTTPDLAEWRSWTRNYTSGG